VKPVCFDAPPQISDDFQQPSSILRRFEIEMMGEWGNVFSWEMKNPSKKCIMCCQNYFDLSFCLLGSIVLLTIVRKMKPKK
jgi:hypothetical protein